MHRTDIIGHAKQLSELQADIDGGNVSHAYLFTGPPHVGKTTVARWFAEKLLTKDAEPSEIQGIVSRMDKLIHPDFLVLDQLWIEEVCEDFEEIAKTTNVPQQHRSKTPTMKTDTIGIDDVREIQDRVNETGEGFYRVCIIRGMERLQDAAANAFLKTLEEPPPGRVFILTTESSTTLPTIVSRSRVMHFDRVSPAEMQPLVADQSSDDQSFLIHLSQGAPGMLMRLLHDPEQRKEERLMHTQASGFWSGTLSLDRLKAAAPLLERGRAADRFLVHLALALRESPKRTYVQERALMELLTGFETNANRTLLVQRFITAIDDRIKA